MFRWHIGRYRCSQTDDICTAIVRLRLSFLFHWLPLPCRSTPRIPCSVCHPSNSAASSILYHSPMSGLRLATTDYADASWNSDPESLRTKRSTYDKSLTQAQHGTRHYCPYLVSYWCTIVTTALNRFFYEIYAGKRQWQLTRFVYSCARNLQLPCITHRLWGLCYGLLEKTPLKQSTGGPKFSNSCQ